MAASAQRQRWSKGGTMQMRCAGHWRILTHSAQQGSGAAAYSLRYAAASGSSSPLAFGDSSWRTGSPMIMAHTADTLRTDQGAWTGPPTQWQSADRLHGNQAHGLSEEPARPLTAHSVARIV